MAIPSLSITPLSRAQGRNACQKAAYNAGCKIRDETTGLEFSHESKSDDILHREIVNFEGSREQLWSDNVERSEKKSNSVVARDGIAALPHELSLECNIEIMREFAEFVTQRYQVAFDFSIHAPEKSKGTDSRNFHSHFMFTTRRIRNNSLFDETGKPNEKTRELDDSKALAKRDDKGEVIRDDAGKILYNKSRGALEVESIRMEWQRIVNAKLEQNGIDARIDMRSYERQGLNKIASVHLGKTDTDLERAGIKTERGNFNREAKKFNEAAQQTLTQQNRNEVWLMFKMELDKKRDAEKREREIDDERRRIQQEPERYLKSADRYKANREELKRKYFEEHKIKSMLNKHGYKNLDEYKKLAYRERKVLQLGVNAQKALQRNLLENQKRKQKVALERVKAEDRMIALAVDNPQLQKYISNPSALSQVQRQREEAARVQRQAQEQAQGLRKEVGARVEPGRQHRASQRPGTRP